MTLLTWNQSSRLLNGSGPVAQLLKQTQLSKAESSTLTLAKPHPVVILFLVILTFCSLFPQKKSPPKNNPQKQVVTINVQFGWEMESKESLCRPEPTKGQSSNVEPR